MKMRGGKNPDYEFQTFVMSKGDCRGRGNLAAARVNPTFLHSS